MYGANGLWFNATRTARTVAPKSEPSIRLGPAPLRGFYFRQAQPRADQRQNPLYRKSRKQSGPETRVKLDFTEVHSVYKKQLISV